MSFSPLQGTGREEEGRGGAHVGDREDATRALPSRRRSCLYVGLQAVFEAVRLAKVAENQWDRVVSF